MKLLPVRLLNTVIYQFGKYRLASDSVDFLCDLPLLLCQMTIIGLCRTLFWFITSILSVWAHDATVAYSAGWAWFCSVGMKAEASKAFLKHMTGTSVIYGETWFACATSCSFAALELHGSLMAYLTPEWLHSGSSLWSLCLWDQNARVQMSRWPLQSAPWCYLVITTCHPKTGNPVSRWTCLHVQHTPIKSAGAVFWSKQYSE